MSQLTQDKPVLEPPAQGLVEATANPLRRTTRMRRILKHPHLMHYNRLIALVMVANLVALTYGLTHGEWWSSQGSALKAIVIVAQANFALAIIIRQPYVINLLHWLATRAPTSWPLQLRWILAKVYHFGGLHVGAAVSGTLWFLVLVGLLTYDAMYRMAVSRAGDWTGRFIDDPPSHVWIRGISTAGMANVNKLFKKVVYVATGSGIGPTLAHILANEMPSHLVWVTRSPRKTYGDALVDEILAVQPDATIWNTDEQGRPDMFRLAYAAYVSSGAEAVICIANKKATWQVVHGLERLGIPACGPIWDS